MNIKLLYPYIQLINDSIRIDGSGLIGQIGSIRINFGIMFYQKV